MPRGGPRGNKRTHKGQRRHFTDESEIKRAAEKEERQKEWRRRQGIESEEEEEVDKVDKVDKVEKGEDGEKVEKGAAAPGDLPPSDSSSEEDSDDESDKHKGVSHLIDIENPNRMGGRSTKKVTELQDSKTELTRREREEIEKQQAKANYQKMHIAGKTDEARADLARLAIIRKQREEAAKKKTEEKAKEDAAKKSSKS